MAVAPSAATGSEALLAVVAANAISNAQDFVTLATNALSAKGAAPLEVQMPTFRADATLLLRQPAGEMLDLLGPSGYETQGYGGALQGEIAWQPMSVPIEVERPG